jgi:hypothetical protein
VTHDEGFKGCFSKLTDLSAFENSRRLPWRAIDLPVCDTTNWTFPITWLFERDPKAVTQARFRHADPS